ncbi:hypothetical protein HanIR_Chr11g0558751 [Helianthus annuus]|nr:hypothetical protein HanIR_Chr11g0558751 [Helianthus annuus]
MSYSGYSSAPSATFERSPSIDPTKHVSYASEPTAPTASSVHNGHSEPQLTATSQSLVPPGQEDVHQPMKSANQISDSGLNSTSFGQAPGRYGWIFPEAIACYIAIFLFTNVLSENNVSYWVDTIFRVFKQNM